MYRPYYMIHRYKDYTQTDSETHRQTGRLTDRQSHRQTDSHTNRETHRQRMRQVVISRYLVFRHRYRQLVVISQCVVDMAEHIPDFICNNQRQCHHRWSLAFSTSIRSCSGVNSFLSIRLNSSMK